MFRVKGIVLCVQGAFYSVKNEKCKLQSVMFCVQGARRSVECAVF